MSLTYEDVDVGDGETVEVVDDEGNGEKETKDDHLGGDTRGNQEVETSVDDASDPSGEV